MEVAIVTCQRLVGESLQAVLVEDGIRARVHAVDGVLRAPDTRGATVVLLSSGLPVDVAVAVARRHAGRAIVFGGPADPRVLAAGAIAGDWAELDQLRECARRVAAGETGVASPERRSPRVRRRRPGFDDLTEREIEVLALVVEGADNQRIADELLITVNTVRTHVQNIFSKLGVHSRFEAVTATLRAGVQMPTRQRDLTGTR